MTGDQIMRGIRVIDFCIAAVGTFTARYLADMGAEVIKVESTTKVDIIRRLDNARDPEKSPSFALYNQNKLGILLNLKRPEGTQLAKRLVSIADVVTENFSGGTMDDLGLGYKDLVKVKPDIVMISMSFAGQSGPYGRYRGHGGVLQSLASIQNFTGWPQGEPMAPTAAFTDHYVPPMWLTAVIAALDHRRRTGEGQYIDASDFECAVDLLDTALLDFGVNEHVQTRRGNRHPYAAPHGVYRCAGDDRWCAIAVFTDEEWAAFRRVLGDPPWAGHDRFSTLLGRLENQDELDVLVEDWTARRTAEEVMLLMQEAGVHAGVVNNGKDLFADPQLLHRQHFWECQEPEMEGFTFKPPPFRLSKTPPRFSRPFPHMGQHNDYVYTELLGLSDAEYAKLLDQNVII